MQLDLARLLLRYTRMRAKEQEEYLARFHHRHQEVGVGKEVRESNTTHQNFPPQVSSRILGLFGGGQVLQVLAHGRRY